MDKLNDRAAQQEPNAAAATLEGRIHAQEDQLGALSRELAAQQDKLRDYEKSLVERIADVDDDRRSTATKLQRAWQTQREEVDRRLRRQTRITAGAIGAFAILLFAVLFVLYQRLETDRAPLVEDIAEMRHTLSRVPENTAAATLLQSELNRLDAALEDTSSDLERLLEAQEQAAETARTSEETYREESASRLEKQLGPLQAEQTRLARELESIRETLSPAPERESRRKNQLEPLQAEQTRLAGELESIRETLTPAPVQETRLKSRLEPLQAEQERLARELESIRKTLKTPAPAAATPVHDPGAETEALPSVSDDTPPAGGSLQAPDAVHMREIETPLEADLDGSPTLAVPAVPVAEPRTAVPDRHSGAADPTNRDDTNRPVSEVDAAGGRRYALQLIGFFSRKSLLEFTRRSDLPPQTYVHEETFRGRPWYVLIHSLHDSFASAKATLSLLPPDLAALDTWIRPISEQTRLEVLPTETSQ